MKPFKHARISAKKFGGSPDDYIDIHEFMDTSKSAFADVRHRVILHNSLGPYICAKVFGDQRHNSEGKIYDVRDVAEQHILDDLGFIPSLDHWIKNMRLQKWMGGNEAKSIYIQRKQLFRNQTTELKTTAEALEVIELYGGTIKWVQSPKQQTCVVSVVHGNIEYSYSDLNILDAVKGLQRKLGEANVE